MGQEYLIDTNTVIDYFAQQLPPNAVSLIDNIIPHISVINRIELLGWPNATTADIAILTSFIDDCVVFELDEDVIVKTIEIRKHFKLKLGDAIIAATAFINNLTLLSRNLADFNKVTGLYVIDPHTL